MKLSTEQITQIDEALVLNKVVYDDIKLELTDHIASDIEVIMTDKEISFEGAFKEAFGKWQGMMKEETFHAFPLLIFWKNAPKMVVDKWFKTARKQLLYSVLISITPFILFLAISILKIGNKESFISTTEVICKYTFLTMFFLILIGRVLMIVSKTKTIYGSLFNFYFLVYMITSLDISNLLIHFKFSIKIDTFSPPVALFYITHISLSLILLYKHFEFEKKLSKV